VIDIRLGSCVRPIERVATTGCVTSSKHPIAEINYCTRTQIDEYLNTFGYKGLRDARDNLPMRKPGKKILSDAVFIKENDYKSQFSKVDRPPITYLERVFNATNGVSLTYHETLGPLILASLAKVDLGNLTN